MVKVSPIVVTAMSAIVAGAFCIFPAQAQDAGGSLVKIEYVAPTDKSYQTVYELAKETRYLERASIFFAPFKLPRPLTLRTQGCDGDVNAYYDSDAISICYEYLRYIAELAKSRNRPAALSEKEAFLGPAIEVFLHEGAHALFDYFHTPLLGKEEDAADQIAALGLLNFDADTSRKLMAGVVHMYMTEGGIRNIRKLGRKRLAVVAPADSSDEHSTPLQRMYSALCMAAGSERADFAELAQEAGLPADRMEMCPDEYAQVVYAFRTLLLPHVDQSRLEDMRKRDWFKPSP